MLPTKHKQYLRAKAHKLKPVVIVGASGLTDNVIAEIDSSIEHHELIKVKIQANDREHRQQMVDKICNTINCEFVSSIGHIAVFFRAAAKARLQLPD